MKPVESFNKKSAKCRECQKAYYREYYKANSEKLKASSAKWSEENHGDENMKEERRLAVAALQDFAAQVGQLVAVFRLREATRAEGTSGDE